jgi:uncharacterized protein
VQSAYLVWDIERENIMQKRVRNSSRILRVLLIIGGIALLPFASIQLYGDTLQDAAKRGDLISVTNFLKSGARTDAKDAEGITALMYASEQGHSNVVEFLLKNGANPSLQEPGAGMTALMVSSAEGHVEVVRLLLQAKADVNAKDSNLGATALLGAAEYGHIDVIKALIEAGADVNAKSKLNRTALMLSAVNGHTSTVNALLAAGADINCKDTKFGTTPLMGAAVSGHMEILKALINKGAKLDEVSINGMTALDMAKARGRTEVVQILQEKMQGSGK